MTTSNNRYQNRPQTQPTRQKGQELRRGRDHYHNDDSPSLSLGFLPPQQTSMEKAILGAILLEKDAFDTVSEILRPEAFYVEAHSKIFACMQAMAGNVPLDIMTLMEAMKKRGELESIGGPFVLMELTNDVVSSANIEAHARIVQQKYMQRELIRISGEILKDAYRDTTDIFDLLDAAETKLMAITSNIHKGVMKTAQQLYDKELKELQLRMDIKEEITGVPSGFTALDSLTYGWQPTDLIIIAARPSVGKTAFALSLARNAALNPIKPTGVALFMLEMSNTQVMQRLISAESEIPLDSIRRGKTNLGELRELAEKCESTLRQAPMFLDDTPALNIFELRAKCRRLVLKYNVGIIIIDYLQLMSGTGDRTGNREQEISKISRDLKALAKELRVPVIALSQLSRDVEKRGAGIPMLSDLRESGAIEQDADMVMFLYRPDYQKEPHEIDPSIRGDVNLKIAKHRNGQLDTIALKSKLSIQKFYDIDPLPGPMSAPKLIPLKEAKARYEPPAMEDDEDELPF
ncbi:replicative DNA helicase [Chitinophaga sp. Hz27]|uniref:replicative DNA helicase n=1 Tax=Chitinophaga sp. Hz27 TaxID=3347169 RepID=UPI0035DA287F